MLVTALNIGLDMGMQMAQVPNDKSLKNHTLQIDNIVQMSIFFFVLLFTGDTVKSLD